MRFFGWFRPRPFVPKWRGPKWTYFIDGPLKDQQRPFEACRYLVTAPILLRTGEIVEGPKYRWDTFYPNAEVNYMRLM